AGDAAAKGAARLCGRGGRDSCCHRTSGRAPAKMGRLGPDRAVRVRVSGQREDGPVSLESRSHSRRALAALGTSPLSGGAHRLCLLVHSGPLARGGAQDGSRHPRLLSVDSRIMNILPPRPLKLSVEAVVGALGLALMSFAVAGALLSYSLWNRSGEGA